MFKLREAIDSDLEAIRDINEAAIPAVNTVSKEEFLWFLERCLYFKVSVDEKEQVCGFLLVLPTGLNYESLNYRWFSKNFSDFAYIDRIAIKKEFRGHGIGKSLYLDLERHVEKSIKRIACEFNIKPENTISKNFHEGLEYKRVGTQFTENETKEVSLMIKEINV
tara:strand:+ start:1804 stop:2298 length:495 start_codon:yes stop_codon:yes gene_type:complete